MVMQDRIVRSSAPAARGILRAVCGIRGMLRTFRGPPAGGPKSHRSFGKEIAYEFPSKRVTLRPAAIHMLPPFGGEEVKTDGNNPAGHCRNSAGTAP